MSRAKMIVGATLSSLVLLSVLVALAQTAEKPPTELYVRTTPPGATIIVDGESRGTSPSLFKVEPGERTVVVKLAGHQTKTKTVTIRDGRIRRVVLRLQKGPDAGAAPTASAAPLAKPRQVRLFHADKSRQHGTPVVLDLASGELLAQPKTADDEAIAKYWDQLGRGDLAYPGEGLMVLRRGTVEQWNLTAKRFEPAKAVFQEPPGAARPLVTGYAINNLPLRFRITSGDGKKFDVTVLEKKPNGDYIEIEYRPLPKSAGPAQPGGKTATGVAEPRNETPEELAKTVVECLRQRDWMALMQWTVVSDKQWKPLEEQQLRAILDIGDPKELDPQEVREFEAMKAARGARKGSHAEDILQDWRRFVERGERDFDIDWSQAEYECAEYRIVKSKDVVGIGMLDFVFSAKGKYYRAGIDDVLRTDRGWLAADGPKWVGQLDKPVISVPVETEIVDQDVAQDGWGEPVEGVQCRVRAEKRTWPQGTMPKLRADLRNQGKRNLEIALEYEGWEIEIDGKWHKTDWGSSTGAIRYLSLGPGQQQQNLGVWFYADDNLSRKLRALEPGKHTLRVARILESATKEPLREPLRAVSNPVEIEITPAEVRPKAPGQEPAWGKQVENLQCRLRAEKAVWTAGTVPKLFGDLRRYDMLFPALATASENWEIEIDGKWHKNQRAKLQGSHGGKVLFLSWPATEHWVQEAVYQLAIDAEQSAARSLRSLAPGKHVLRAGYRFGALPASGVKNGMEHNIILWDGKAVHVVSNPIEIEILPAKPATEAEKGTWGPAVEGVQIRLWAEKKTWRVDEEVILKVDCRNQGKRDLMLDDRTGCFDVYVGYRMYSPDPNTTNLSFPAPFGPGRHYNGRPIGLGRYVGLKLAPGKHTIRVVLKAAQNTVRPLEGAKAGTTMNKDELQVLAQEQEIEKRLSQLPVVVSSNPIEIEIVAAKPTTGAGVSGKRKLSPRKLFSTSHGEGAGVLAVAFSPDGLTVAAVDEQGNVALRDARSGGQRWGRGVLTPEEKKPLLYEDRKGRIHTASIAFSPDGYTLAVAADAVVRLYDAQSGRLLRALEDKQLIEALKALKRPPATVSRERELLAAVPHAHGRVYSVAFSPDAALLATSGSHLIRADGSSVINAELATPGKLKIWDAKTGELKRDLGEHFGAVRSVAFSPDAKTLASIGSHPPMGTSSVRLWDPQTGAVKRVLRILPYSMLEKSVAFSPDGKLVAAGALVTGLKEDGPAGGIERLGAGRKCRLLIFNARTGDLLFHRDTAGRVTSLSFSADGQTLAAGVEGEGVTLWDPETLTQKGQIQPSPDPPREVQVAFSPTGNVLAVGAEDEKHGFVTVWEIGDSQIAAER